MGHKVTDISAAELIEELADAFESGTLKWTTGSLVNDNGAVCLVGGLRMLIAAKSCSLRPYVRLTIACGLIVKHLGLPFPHYADNECSVILWNDGGFMGDDNNWHLGAWGQQNVIDVLKATAKDIRNKAAAA